MRLLFICLMLALTESAFAGYVPFDNNMRPAVGGQQIIPEYQSAGSPAVGSATRYVASTSSPSGTGLVITTFAAQPDSARNVIVTPAGTTADVTACTVTVNGTNIRGKAISETFAITGTQSSATTGAKAFKTLTSVSIPAACETGSNADTSWKVGSGAKLGLNRCLNFAGDFIQSSLNGVKEATASTIVASATAIESNTATLNSTLNGNAVLLMYVQNYRCLP